MEEIGTRKDKQTRKGKAMVRYKDQGVNRRKGRHEEAKLYKRRRTKRSQASGGRERRENASLRDVDQYPPERRPQATKWLQLEVFQDH